VIPLTRRHFVWGAGVAGLGLLAGCGRLPGHVEQSTRVPRIGLLVGGASGARPQAIEAFRQALRERGYVEGQNVAVHYRTGAGRIDSLSGLASELVSLQVAVIRAGAGPATGAAKTTTATIEPSTRWDSWRAMRVNAPIRFDERTEETGVPRGGAPPPSPTIHAELAKPVSPPAREGRALAQIGRNLDLRRLRPLDASPR
jgi:hypothetical protein